MSDYPCEDMRKLMEGESAKFPCEWVKENWNSGGGDDDSFGKLIDRSIATAVVPDGVTSIGFSAFNECTSLTSITIPDSVTSIGDFAFYDCTSLTSITIPNSVTNIGSNAFGHCTNLLTINCGFAEGAVSGAPWGAENAVINYNVTE